MRYDGKLDIAVGKTARSKRWKNTRISWSDLVERLSKEHKTTETFKEYMAASKDEKLQIKDVGGYVGGLLNNGRRKPGNVVHRQLLTLDVDFAYTEFWEDYTLQFDNAAVLHATHSHHEDSPRYRLILPLSREVSPDEYAAVARYVAGQIDIEIFDNTTFEVNRLMFWPSNPSDIDYFFKVQDGPWIDPDEILSNYKDWKDSSEWPTAEKQMERVRKSTEKQEDPQTKKGLVGVFCRSYSITDVLETFLKDSYTAGRDGRWTYALGSTVGGLVTYEDKFAFSHHGTDPSGGRLCNAYDLVRIHLYGHLDENDPKQTASLKAMNEMVKSDPKVKKLLASEALTGARYAFESDEDVDMDAAIEEAVDWMEELDVDSHGNYTATAANTSAILQNDMRLKGLFRYNEFDNKIYVVGSPPWRRIQGDEPIRDVDFAGLRNYVEVIYGISTPMKLDDALALEIHRNSYHPVREYLSGLKWDGVPRVDELLIRYFGAKDELYTREAIRKTLVGAVARIFSPGVKFDTVLVLISEQQGTGKSSFLKTLGGRWFSDTFMSVHGRDALEQIQGSWIIEIAELAGFRKAESEAIKLFFSKQIDSFRKAYGRVSETYYRQCIFVATTNKKNFLKDPTGDRRFIPVDLHNVKLRDNEDLKNFLSDQKEVDQVWAEAVQLFKDGEPLFLSRAAEEVAEVEQRSHAEDDPRMGVIEEYLETKLPEAWDEMGMFERRQFLASPEEFKLDDEYRFFRDEVCVAEVWCECLGRERHEMQRRNSNEISEILKTLPGWEHMGNSTKRFPLYGTQRYFQRKLE